jgi:hypothetical protein
MLTPLWSLRTCSRQYKTVWKQIVHEYFPEPTNPEMVTAEQDCSSKTNFYCALELFIIKTLHKKKPPDWQYIYVISGGNYKVRKMNETSSIDHFY